MWIKIVQLLMSLSLLVIVHELGHFLFAKIFKCRVEKFYLFFDWKFSLFKKKIGDTVYGIGWIPLGGYVKIAGMVDESMDKDQLAEAPKPWEYRSKPAWQRLLIIVGGVLMNLVLAFAIYVGMAFAWGDQYIKTKDVHTGFEFSEVGQSIGFRNGDKILTVDGKEIDNARAVAQAILLGSERRVVLERGGERVEFTVSDAEVGRILKDAGVPFMQLRSPFVVADSAKGFLPGDSLVAADSVPMRFADEFRAAFAMHKGDSISVTYVRGGEELTHRVAVDTAGLLGVHLQPINLYPVTTREYTFFEAIPRGAEMAVDQVSGYFDQLGLIFSPETEAYKGVGGFIAMGKLFPDAWSWSAFWGLTALISIMLAVLNIMPVPGLDGGHLVFILYEMVTGRAPSQKFMEGAQYVGFVLIIGLVLVVNGSDIVKLFT